ncbi:hypothetical protein SCHPADRAFT_918911 [Schizopora paradoxa]|uniref:Probable beta-glucosidase E n=1 Tax=Schizopora paradoxa TaxID=27342 RepID=A0A0H2SAB4_9AGAM|nr:hypothetical protein SCHPADRAFT_918911 [Schizopora paradoxa]
MSRRGSAESDQKTSEEVALLKRTNHLDTSDSSTRLRDDDTFDENDPLNIDPEYVDRGERSKERQRGGRSSRFAVVRKFILRRKKCCIASTAIASVVLIIISIGAALLRKSVPETRSSPPWYPTPPGGTLPSWKNAYEKAARLVDQMSLIEKVNITTGTGWQMGLCVGNTGPAVNVKFPSLCLQDGPLGIRFADNITAFPAGITVGATWNRDLMFRRGQAHGREARLKGVNIILGPAMGPLGKMPAAGRNWEGFGADPVLQGVAAAETIKGIQSEGVIATAKHFILNEQEHFRQSFEWGLPTALSSNIDDRTLHELYLWPFAESVRAGVASIMCSYQMVNNSYACGNSKILNGILKDELGFQGFVQSDWLAQRSGVASALAGLDMSMPGDGLLWANGKSLWGRRLTLSVLNGSLPMSRLNDMATRIVAAWYQLKQDDPQNFPSPPPEGEGGPNFSSWTNEETGLLYHGSGEGPTGRVNKFLNVQGEGNDAHGIVARQIAAEATVLLKNDDNILPLSRSGWGEGWTKGPANSKFKVAIIGDDAGEGKGPNFCPDRGCNQGTLGSGWGSGAVEFPYLVAPVKALENAFDPNEVIISTFLTNDVPPSNELLDVDLCLIFINSDAGEGYLGHDGINGDRNDLFAQKGGDKLAKSVIQSCGSGNGKSIVIVHSVGPVVVENWVDEPGLKGLIFANLPGQESGNALVDVLFGDVNPSGKLPYTVGKSLADYGAGGQVLYRPNGIIPQQDYSEGLYIDYRHFDKYAIPTRYEFGYGLSYTTFSFSSLKITPTKPKSPLPSPRPTLLSPPSLSTNIPSADKAVFPDGFLKLKKFVYPYIRSVDEVKAGDYPYPDGYDSPNEPSQAGGGEGGNPSLWDVHAEVALQVSNTGGRKGKEVVQLYVSFPDDVPVNRNGNTWGEGSVDFPVKVLRNFTKIELDPSTSTIVSFQLTRKDLSYWSVYDQNWIMPTNGKFTIWVGNSSQDISLSGML